MAAILKKRNRRMSKADVLFVNMCEKILEEGFSSEGMQVRARWEDKMAV